MAENTPKTEAQKKAEEDRRKARANERRRLARLKRDNLERTRYVSFADYRAAQAAPAEQENGGDAQ